MPVLRSAAFHGRHYHALVPRAMRAAHRRMRTPLMWVSLSSFRWRIMPAVHSPAPPRGPAETSFPTACAPGLALRWARPETVFSSYQPVLPTTVRDQGEVGVSRGNAITLRGSRLMMVGALSLPLSPVNIIGAHSTPFNSTVLDARVGWSRISLNRPNGSSFSYANGARDVWVQVRLCGLVFVMGLCLTEPRRLFLTL